MKDGAYNFEPANLPAMTADEIAAKKKEPAALTRDGDLFRQLLAVDEYKWPFVECAMEYGSMTCDHELGMKCTDLNGLWFMYGEYDWNRKEEGRLWAATEARREWPALLEAGLLEKREELAHVYRRVLPILAVYGIVSFDRVFGLLKRFGFAQDPSREDIRSFLRDYARLNECDCIYFPDDRLAFRYMEDDEEAYDELMEGSGRYPVFEPTIDDLDSFSEYPHCGKCAALSDMKGWLDKLLKKSRARGCAEDVLEDAVMDLRFEVPVEDFFDQLAVSNGICLNAATRRTACEKLAAVARGIRLWSLNGNTCDELVEKGVMSDEDVFDLLERYGLGKFAGKGARAARGPKLTDFQKAVARKARELEKEVVDDFGDEGASRAMSRIVLWTYDERDVEEFAKGMRENGMGAVCEDKAVKKDAVRSHVVLYKIIEDEFHPEDRAEIDRLVSYGKYYLDKIEEFLESQTGTMCAEDIAIAKREGHSDSVDWEPTIYWLMNAKLIVPDEIVCRLWGETGGDVEPRAWTGACTDGVAEKLPESEFGDTLGEVIKDLQSAVEEKYGDVLLSRPLSRAVCWLVVWKSKELVLEEDLLPSIGKLEEADSRAAGFGEFMKGRVKRLRGMFDRIVDDTLHPATDAEREGHLNFIASLLCVIFSYLDETFLAVARVPDVEFAARHADDERDSWLTAICWLARYRGKIPELVKLELWGEDDFLEAVKPLTGGK